MLGLIVLGLVLAVTLLFALAAYLIDRGEERLEDQELGQKSIESIAGDARRTE